MRYFCTLTLAAALALDFNAHAANSSNEFELTNKTAGSVSAELRVHGAKPVKKELKKFEVWKTKFDHAKLPTLHITTGDGDELAYEFEVAAHQSLKLVLEKNWKSKELEVKPKFATDNVTKDGIRKAETETPVNKEPAEEPAPGPIEEPAEEPANEEPKEVPAPVTPTLKVKIEQLFDAEPSMTEVEKAHKILNVKFISDVRVAMGEQEPKSPEDLKRAEAAVTAAYKAQAKIWKPDAKLNYKVVAAMKNHDVTDPKDQKALAAKGLELIEETYKAVEKKFK